MCISHRLKEPSRGVVFGELKGYCFILINLEDWLEVLFLCSETTLIAAIAATGLLEMQLILQRKEKIRIPINVGIK